MGAVKRVLVVGGGIGGMSAAITLAGIGVQVELVDLDPQWKVYGAGITITGATLRAFKALGVLPQILAEAFVGDGIQICDVSGHRLTVVQTPVVAGEDIPSSGGIMRPVLHRVLSERTLSTGTKVRLGITVERLNSHQAGVDVLFSDGSQAMYDAVIGADGLFSKVRSLLFPAAPKPEYTGQSVWRLVVERPMDIDRRHFFLGGPAKVGLTPVSETEMYMFYLETTPRRPVVPDDALASELRDLLEGYGGPLSRIRESLGSHSRIVVRPLEYFVLPPPWHLGRTILIGDAAHPTTPQLASGAGMAVEDALVLAEEFAKAGSVESAFAGFMGRRYERCRLVVDNSIEIGRREQARVRIEDQTRLVEESLRALAQPI